MAQQPIDAAKIPVPDLFAATLSVDAGFLRTDAADIRARGADVTSSWAGLSGVYTAPEDADLFAVMDPVSTATDTFATDVESVASTLETFAAEAGPLAATLASTKTAAQAFGMQVADNDKWDHDSDLVNQNNDYVHTVNTTICAYQAAERRAANAIEALIGGHSWHATDPNSTAKDPYAYGYDSIPDNAKTPWGADVQKKDGCLKSTFTSVGHFFVGIGTGAWNLVKGVGVLAWDAVGAGGWDKFKQAWEGIAFLGTLLLAPATGGASVLTGMAIWGPKGYTQRLTAMGKGMLDWDEWKTDPAKAAGEVVFNFGSLAIPVGGEVAAVADGARGAELAADASRAAELAGDAGKAGKFANAVKDGSKIFAKYTDPFTYAGKLPKVLDIANSMKTKFGDLTGLTGKGSGSIDHTMAGWDHPGTSSHDGSATATHDGGTGHDGTDSSGHDGTDSSGHDGTEAAGSGEAPQSGPEPGTPAGSGNPDAPPVPADVTLDPEPRNGPFEFNGVDNPGPLAAMNDDPFKSPAANFAGGQYNAQVLSHDVVLFRGGTEGKPLGQWFTATPPQSVAEVRIDSAVKPVWVDPTTGAYVASSPVDTVYEIRVPAGTTIFRGPTAYQGGIYLGGPEQIFVPKPWSIEGVDVVGEWALK